MYRTNKHNTVKEKTKNIICKFNEQISNLATIE